MKSAVESACNFTFFSFNTSASFGKNASAILRCTKRVSNVLHVLGRWVLAFKITGRAFSKSALSSTNMWQTPIPPTITGIVECSLANWCNAAPPRGIIMSTYWSNFNNSITNARSGSVIACTAVFGKPAWDKAFCTTSTNTWLECCVSFPPRKITALPVFKHRLATSIVTFGRAS